MNMKMRLITLLCLFVIACCPGCGKTGYKSKTGFNVGGKVTYKDGKPVNSGKVTLTSGWFTADGDIIAEGSYSISGRVPAGTYKASVQAFEYSPTGMTADVATPAKSLLAPRFDSPDTSGLVCEVKGPTTFNITVEKP